MRGQKISAGQAEDYYEKDDYHRQAKEIGNRDRLTWANTPLARQLKLRGEVGKEEWKEAIHGRFPDGTVIPGRGVDKMAGTDFVIEAPKSLAIAALVGKRDDLLDIHRDIAKGICSFVSDRACAQIHKGGKHFLEKTGESVYASTNHLLNRDGEPFVHTHAVFLNVTRTADGRYRAAENALQLKYQYAGHILYQLDLSRRYAETGIAYRVGPNNTVELADISDVQNQAFSTRTTGEKGINAYLRDVLGVEPDQATKAQRDLAWTKTRKTKKTQDLSELAETWQQTAAACGLDAMATQGQVRKLSPGERKALAEDSLTYAIEALSERESAFSEAELLVKAGKDLIGSGAGMEDLMTALDLAYQQKMLIQSPRLVGDTVLVTTPAALETEKQVRRMEREGRRAVESIMTREGAAMALEAKAREAGLTLSDEQINAGVLILSTDNQYIGIQGRAGVGKTSLLAPAVQEILGRGYHVIGLAPQHRAVEALTDSGVSDVRTVASFLTGRIEDINERTLILVDEAGLANIQQVKTLMTIARSTGARIVFVGDTAQYESVEAGPVFRFLQASGMEIARVETMRRQQTEELRTAANLSLSDPREALAHLDVREVIDPEDRYRAIAMAYVSMTPKERSETLVITGENRAKRAITAEIREGLGLAGTGRETEVFVKGGETVADRKRLKAYAPGQSIRFSKEYRAMDIKSGEIWTVSDILDDGRLLITEKDRELVIDPRKLSGKGHEIGKMEKMEVAPGDTLKITSNDLKKSHGLTNGMLVKVDAVDDSGIHVTIGRTGERKTIPWTHRGLDYGTVITGHGAQGLGKKNLLWDIDAESRTTSHRAFYTTLTRAKVAVQAFTGDRGALEQAVERKTGKRMAQDVMMDADTHQNHLRHAS